MDVSDSKQNAKAKGPNLIVPEPDSKELEQAAQESEEQDENMSDSDFEMNKSFQKKYFQKGSKTKNTQLTVQQKQSPFEKSPNQMPVVPPLHPDPSIIKSKKRPAESSDIYKQAGSQQTLL